MLLQHWLTTRGSNADDCIIDFFCNSAVINLVTSKKQFQNV